MAVCNPQVDPATNKLVGYQFDDAGNTKTDADNRQFIYDGENKQVEVKDQYGVSIGKYFYDGDGKRVKKITNTETTVFVYNAGGQLVAEYSTQISQQPQVSYLTSDHLGSPRINTDANGQVIARHDYQPFGEEIQRASYGADQVRKQFTGYEKDDETDLDFAQARYFNSGFGRFSSPDPLYFTAERLIDPQQFNLYVYVRNNPLKYIDINGEDYIGINGEKVEVEYLRNKKGKIIGIKSVGENATEDLKKIVALIQKFDSKEALSDFIKGDNIATRINISLGGGSYTSPKESADGVPEYIKDPKTGKWIYKEVTLHISINNVDKLKGIGNMPGFKEQVEKEFNVSNLTQEEYTLASFGHETNHGTDTEEIESRRRIFLNKNLNKKDRDFKLDEQYQNVDEPKARDRTQKILNEIKKLK